MNNKSLLGLLLLTMMSLSACSFGGNGGDESKESKSESQSTPASSISSENVESTSEPASQSEISSSLVSSEESSSLVSNSTSSEKPSSGPSSFPSSEQPVGHEHEWETSWTKDPDYHWHKCQSCPEIDEKEEHEWDAGAVTKNPGAYSVGIKTYTCTVCGHTKTEEIPATGGGETVGNFTFDETALSTPQEIHTANQKKYLNLGIQYYNITANDLSSCSASGNTNVSTPNKVTVSWTYSAPAGKTVSKYQLLYGQRSDLGDAYTIEGTTAQSVSFYNPYLGDNYFKVIANFSDGTKEASEIKVFKVDTQAPRNISAGNLPNVRDMGGRETYAGGKIKQGLIYRGAGHNFDQRNTSVNTEGKNVILNQLKVKTEINVANSTGNNLSNSGVNVSSVVNAYMAYGSTPYSNLARNSVRIRQVMDTLADINNYPVFYHCRIGTDRTGITGMMIGGLLGIPFNEVFQDYCFSNFAPIDGQRYPNKPSDPNGDDPAKYIDEILAMPGETYQEQTYNALLSIGCKPETLNTIIDIMTEGPKADLSVNGVVGEGNSLSSTGTKRTSTDYKNPATYYELSRGKEATLTANITDGEKDIVVYLGSSDASDSTKLASCITLTIDGEEQEIANNKNLWQAGFGNTQQDSRIGYMFNILGQYEFDEGEHEITITVKSGSFNLGTIAVFDHVEPNE